MFLDRDGTLNAPVVRDGQPFPPATVAEFTLLPGVAPGLAWLGVMQPLVNLQVLIRGSSSLVLASDPLGLAASVSIAGVGVAL